MSARKGFSLFISNKDINYIIKIKKNTWRFRYINWCYYWNSKTWNEINKRWISTFGCFIGTTYDFLSNKKDFLKRGQKSRKRICGETFLVPLHPLSNIEITKNWITNLGLLEFFSRDNLPRIKHGAYAINLNDKQSKEIHWVLSFIDSNTTAYFDSFRNEYILQEILNQIKDKSIMHNIFRMQSDDSTMSAFYCIAFIEYMIARKTFLDYTNLFSLNDFKKNEKI